MLFFLSRTQVISIQISRAFVEMRKIISASSGLLMRMEKLESNQLDNHQKFEQIFTALESRNALPDKGIFYEGQIFDAYVFISDLIRKAERSIILIDNYVDDSVLKILTKRKSEVTVSIYTKSISKQLELDIKSTTSNIFPLQSKFSPLPTTVF
jgi:hypothetical protein